MRRNKELYSSFRDTYFLDYCGSRKVQNRFLRGPLYERVFMNVLLVNWKMFPSRRCCLPSCNLACLGLAEGRKKSKGKKKNKKKLRLSQGWAPTAPQVQPRYDVFSLIARPACEGLDSAEHARIYPLVPPSALLVPA